MQSDAARLGVTLAALGTLLAVVAAALAGLGAAWWVWTGFLIWGALWVIAALGLGDAASRAFLSGTLRKSTYTQIYITLTRRLLTPLWNRYCHLIFEKAPWPNQFRAALTWRLYDRALLIAVAYPILLLVGQWVWTGNEGRMGNFVMLPEAERLSERTLVIVFLLTFPAVIVIQKIVLISKIHIVKKFAVWLPLLFFAVAVFAPLAILGAGADLNAAAGIAAGLYLLSYAGSAVIYGAYHGIIARTMVIVSAIFVVVLVAVAGSGAGIGTWVGAAIVVIAVAFAVAIAGPGAGAIAFVLSVAAAGAASGASAIAIASAVVITGQFLERHRWHRAARVLITCSFLFLIPTLAVTLDWSAIPEDALTLFLFLAVLPLLNALFDVISYAATLSLTRRGLQSRLPLLWGLADLALACALFLALGATLVAAIHALNLLAGVPFLDLPALFEGAAPPSWAYFWLYAMLFSTILPTALHAALSLLGLQGIWPRPLRRHVATWIDSTTTSPLASFRASLALGLIWTLPVLALMLIAAALWWGLGDAIRWTLAHYLDALLWIATHPLNAL